MLNYNVKIGLVPMRRDCTPRPGAFNWEIAEARGREIVAYIEEHYATENVTFADLKGVIPVETFYAESDVEKVAAHMRAEKVDALLMINANFGCEEAAALLAQEMNVPVMLWAPLDERFDADGMRYTDSQCGIFGISRQMQRYNIPFTFLNSCRVSEQKFAEGLDRFARVACMVKNFRGMRVGQVGMRPKIFCSVIFNEGELMQRFGLHIVPINNALVAKKFNKILQERDAELVEGEKLFITSNSEIGDVFEEMSVKNSGSDIVIAFNVKYMMELIRVVSGDEMTVKFGTPVSPCVIAPVSGDDYTYLVLPVRLNA